MTNKRPNILQNMTSIRRFSKITQLNPVFQQQYFSCRTQYYNLNFEPQGCEVTSICLITDIQNKHKAILKLEASFALLGAMMGNRALDKFCALKQQVLTLCPRMAKLGTFVVHGMFLNFLLNAPGMTGHLSVSFCLVYWYLAFLRILKDTDARPRKACVILIDVLRPSPNLVLRNVIIV